MIFTSDNASPAAPEVIAAVVAANEGMARPYGADALMEEVRTRLREIFEAPEAAVHLVATGTAANALAIASFCPPWGAVFCHEHAHVEEDECGAPEFYTGGAKLVGLPGPHGRIAPGTLEAALERTGAGDVHCVQRGMLSLTNVTEAGTLYRPAEIAALAALARGFGLPVHLDGARLANALAATGASPAEMTWRAGVDVLSLGGTKNGLLGAEAVVIFDPARAWEFELRRKRGGHLLSKHRYLSAQMAAYLEDGLWLRLAERANRAGARLAEGLAGVPGVTLTHPAEANMVFADWPEGREAAARAAGADFYDMPAAPGRAAARLVCSWSTTEAEVDAFVALMRG